MICRLTLCGHLEVSCLPCHRPSWNPCGSRSPRCCPPARSPTRWAATARASPTGSCSTSSSRCWCSAAATAASPTTPARPLPCGAAGMSGSLPGSPSNALGGAGRLRSPVRPAPGPLGGGQLYHQGALRWPDRRPQPVDRRKQGLKRSVAVEADGVPLAAVPAPANHRDDGLLAATLDAITVVGPLSAQPVVHLDAATTISPAGRSWPNATWSARSPPAVRQPRFRRVAAG